MSSLSNPKPNVDNVNQDASGHKDYHLSQALTKIQSELAHHEGPYAANNISSKERKAAIRAWLEEISNVVGDIGNNVGDFDSLAIFVGSHLNVETHVASITVQEHVKGSNASGKRRDHGEESMTPTDIDADEVDKRVKASISASGPKS